MEARTRALKMTCITLSALGAALVLVLLLVFLASPRIQAAPLRRYRAGTGDDPAINRITMAANFPYYDPTSGDGIDKTVYFSNGVSGAITMTFDISGTPALTLTAGAAFDEPERIYTSTNQTWSQAITYSVVITRATQPHIVYTAIITNSKQTTVAITYVQDITAPTVSIASPPTGYFTGTQLVITGTAQDNVGGSGVQQVQVTTDTIWITDTNIPWQVTTTFPTADGWVYTITARAEDHLGTGMSDTRVITVDNVIPVNPDLITTTNGALIGTWIATNTVPVTWNLVTDGSGITYYHVWTTISTTAVEIGDSSSKAPPMTGTNLFQGDNWLHLRTRDGAGNWATDTAHVGPFKVDTVSPVAVISTPSAGVVLTTALSSILISGTATDVGEVSGIAQVLITTGTTWVTADGDASWAYIWMLPITDHVVYTLTARAYDQAANVGVSPDVTVTIDTVAPMAMAPTPDRSPWVTSSVAYTWPDSNDNAGLAGYQVNITNTEGYSGLFSTANPVLTLTQSLIEGAGHYARVRAIDNNGNVGVWSGPSTVVTPDLTASSVMTPSIDTQNNECLHAVGTTLYYTNQVDDPLIFYIEGYSLDDLSGVDRVAFSPAFGESPVDVTSGFWPWRPVWPGYGVDPYTTTVGVITATIYDKAGNTEIQTYIYALDGTPPDSTAWSPDYAASSPITITWAATDTQSGVYSTTLWYKKEATGDWTPSLATGGSGAFAFNPLSGDGTYYFQTVAADNVTNVEGGPAGDGDDSTVYDTIPPANVTITAPRHISMTRFFVSWSAQDATSGVATYTVEYSGTADTAWQEWLTGVISAEAEFHAPATETDYVFRVTAYDRAGNNDWQETTTRVGIFYIYLPLVIRNYPPPWQQASGTDEIVFYDVAVCPSDPLLQYAGTKSDGLYHSKDGGNAWQHWALDGRATPVVVNPTNCNEAFVAAWGSGVYRVTGQNQATSINQGLEELYLYGMAITTDGQTLYAGSASHGVFRTSIIADVNWIAINNSIPPDDLRIRSLYIIDDVLYAGGRQCTYYHSDNEGNSWSKETVLGGGQAGECEDAQVWAIAQVDGVLYAGLGLDKGLYRRSTGGTWAQVSDVPAVNILRLGLLFHQSQLYVSAYGRGVYTCRSDGRCQPLLIGGLGTSDVRGLAIAEINTSPRLLVGSDDGIWWAPLIP